MIKTNNKQIRDAYKRYLKSDTRNLWEAYKSASRAKHEAFQYCVDLFRRLNGRRMRIIGANSMTFSVGFEFPHPDDGCACFAYITKDYDRYTVLDEWYKF